MLEKISLMALPYEDDTKIGRYIISGNDTSELYMDLTIIKRWEDNCLTRNLSKCHVMSILPDLRQGTRILHENPPLIVFSQRDPELVLTESLNTNTNYVGDAVNANARLQFMYT